MNVSHATRMTPTPATTARPAAGLDVTVSDGGVRVHASTPSAPPAPMTAPQTTQSASAVASTPELQQTLSTGESEALAERFASLPRDLPGGLYGRAGRQAAPPLAAQQGRLIDITG